MMKSSTKAAIGSLAIQLGVLGLFLSSPNPNFENASSNASYYLAQFDLMYSYCLIGNAKPIAQSRDNKHAPLTVDCYVRPGSRDSVVVLANDPGIDWRFIRPKRPVWVDRGWQAE